tara:strand:+ start:355 stop:1212 length:858 start_codon:yes stop_codon:yes gene_type:complete
MSKSQYNTNNAYEVLIWQLEAGIDHCIGDEPNNRFNKKTENLESTEKKAVVEINNGDNFQSIKNNKKVGNMGLIDASNSQSLIDIGSASDNKLALSSKSLEELEAVVRGFDDCALKKTSANTVFSSGNSGSPVMFVGEAPGADEDKEGRPFVGASGRLFDKMLASIGIIRDEVYLTNTIYWRPPGNRPPTSLEVAQCLPFLQRQIELVRPDILVPLGGLAAQTLLKVDLGITLLRGQWHEYALPDKTKILTLPMFHPAYLLRSPVHKREAWRDMIALSQKLSQKQ